jgi:putative flippase GtrA
MTHPNAIDSFLENDRRMNSGRDPRQPNGADRAMKEHQPLVRTRRQALLDRVDGSIDMWEFVRFFVTGVTATVGNLSTVWLVRPWLSYQISILVGIAVGFTISFLLTKLFAFRSPSWKRAGGELARFILVYGVGVAINWTTSMVLGAWLLHYFLPPRFAELAGALVGSSTMMFTSYFGHRHFTYRSRHKTKSTSG